MNGDDHDLNEGLLVETDGPVRHIWFNRPEKRNAITDAMDRAFASALDSAARDDSIKSSHASWKGASVLIRT